MRIFRFCLSLWVAGTLTLAHAQEPPSAPPMKGAVIHEVGPEDTLGVISRLYGVSPESLREQNGGKRPTAGCLLWIPPSPHGWVEHSVGEGQTLEVIAKGYSIPLQQLRDANALASDDLVAGQVLILPRIRKPQWTAVERPRITASRGGRAIRPPRRPEAPLSEWVEVTLADGRVAWVKAESLVFDPPKPKVPPAAPQPKPTMSFGKKLSASQKEAILKLVERLEGDGFRVKADDIINFMALETGGTFSPSVRFQGRRNGPVGLAQFTDIAIRDMNRRRPPGDQLSKNRLANMSFAEQSTVVGDYLSTAFARKKMQGKAVSAADLYSAIFAPRAIGAPMESTVYSLHRDGRAYSRNRSLDRNKDGRITKTEMVYRLSEWARRGEAQRG